MEKKARILRRLNELEWGLIKAHPQIGYSVLGVEAMASHRPYRPPPGLDEALAEISRKARVLYSPEVVDVCQKLFTEQGFTFE